MKKTYIYGSLCGLVNGFFGTGGGVIAVYTLQKSGMDKRSCNATAVSIILPLSIISVIVYFLGNKGIDFFLLAKVITGGVVGGFIGGKLLGKIKYIIIARVYCAMMVVAGVTMLIRN